MGDRVCAGKHRDADKPYDAWIQQVNECMAAVDEGVGRVLAALEAPGQLENTRVVYTADQGYGLGVHGFNDKGAPYDATVSSPLIISWPGRIPSGKVCRHPISTSDLVGLLCRTAGVTVPWIMHGRDIRPLLANPETTDWNSPVLMAHTGRNYGAETTEIPTDKRLTTVSGVPWYAMLRDGGFKYVRYLVAGETEELYDFDSDPDDLTNSPPCPSRRRASGTCARRPSPSCDGPTQDTPITCRRRRRKVAHRVNPKLPCA